MNPIVCLFFLQGCLDEPSPQHEADPELPADALQQVPPDVVEELAAMGEHADRIEAKLASARSKQQTEEAELSRLRSTLEEARARREATAADHVAAVRSGQSDVARAAQDVESELDEQVAQTRKAISRAEDGAEEAALLTERVEKELAWQRAVIVATRASAARDEGAEIEVTEYVSDADRAYEALLASQKAYTEALEPGEKPPTWLELPDRRAD